MSQWTTSLGTMYRGTSSQGTMSQGTMSKFSFLFGNEISFKQSIHVYKYKLFVSPFKTLNRILSNDCLYSFMVTDILLHPPHCIQAENQVYKL